MIPFLKRHSLLLFDLFSALARFKRAVYWVEGGVAFSHIGDAVRYAKGIARASNPVVRCEEGEIVPRKADIGLNSVWIFNARWDRMEVRMNARRRFVFSKNLIARLP